MKKELYNWCDVLLFCLGFSFLIYIAISSYNLHKRYQDCAGYAIPRMLDYTFFENTPTHCLIKDKKTGQWFTLESYKKTKWIRER